MIYRIVVLFKNAYFINSNIALRPVAEIDFDSLIKLRNDPSTWMNLSDPRPIFNNDQKKWLENLSKSGLMYFAAFDAEHSFIGIVRMDEHDLINRNIRAGVDIINELRGKGYGTKIWKAVMDYCFNVLGVHKIWFTVLETNSIAIKLYNNLGFSEEGRMRQHIYRNGIWLDCICMSILKDEWEINETI